MSFISGVIGEGTIFTALQGDLCVRVNSFLQEGRYLPVVTLPDCVKKFPGRFDLGYTPLLFS